jgi:hypothetical protein
MDTFVTWILIVILFLQGLDVVLLPFFIGRPRKLYSVVGWFMSGLVFGALLIVAGYVWGWW